MRSLRLWRHCRWAESRLLELVVRVEIRCGQFSDLSSSASLRQCSCSVFHAFAAKASKVLVNSEVLGVPSFEMIIGRRAWLFRQICSALLCHGGQLILLFFNILRLADSQLKLFNLPVDR